MLQEGEVIPNFCLQGIDEKGNEREICIREFKGKKVVLYFYPKDNTPGCTQEACDFRDNLNILKEMGYIVIGISPDSVNSHKKFKEKHGLNFILLSDPDKRIAQLFGAYGEKKAYGKVTKGIIRSTFVIDEKGRIIKEWRNVKAKGHVAKVVETLKELEKRLQK
ncbi:MAG TPA: thioredoxin-dependent thiol peroxidase [Aquifex aeolicus]|nr:thioredoxin-dependent thiol peroxidase [Aquifex aeolicus]